MANLQRTLDAEYHYQSGHGRLRCCRIRIYEDLSPPDCGQEHGPRVVIIATMLWNRPDRCLSLTNEAERIATKVLQMQRDRKRRRGQRRAEIDAWEWYEHWPTPPDAHCPEALSRVRFETLPDGSLACPRWTPTDKYTVERRIGQPLD